MYTLSHQMLCERADMLKKKLSIRIIAKDKVREIAHSKAIQLT